RLNGCHHNSNDSRRESGCSQRFGVEVVFALVLSVHHNSCFLICDRILRLRPLWCSVGSRLARIATHFSNASPLQGGINHQSRRRILAPSRLPVLYALCKIIT